MITNLPEISRNPVSDPCIGTNLGSFKQFTPFGRGKLFRFKSSKSEWYGVISIIVFVFLFNFFDGFIVCKI